MGDKGFDVFAPPDWPWAQEGTQTPFVLTQRQRGTLPKRYRDQICCPSAAKS